jgi:hypothetical protein
MIHVHHFATLKQVSDKKLKNKNQKQKSQSETDWRRYR